MILFLKDESERKRAEDISKKLNIKIVGSQEEIKEDELMLILDKDGLSLMGQGMVLHGDFSKLKNRIKQGALQGEMLVKAAKIKKKDKELKAIDATAGLGEDSFLLAASGFQVDLYESNPVIFLLLEDAVERAMKIPDLESIVNRMRIFNQDSIEAMNRMKIEQIKPDVVYLDPMFPERTKSALIKKKFQLLQQLECPCLNEKEILDAAIMLNPHKIVIKRPLKGKLLADVKPSYSVKGKAIRYDCILGK